MKIRRLRVENALSFLEPNDILFDGDISILVGPNGGGKSNLLDIISSTIRRHVIVPWELNQQTDGFGVQKSVGTVSQTLAPNIELYFEQNGRPQIIEVELEVTSVDLARFELMRTTPNLRAEYSGTLGTLRNPVPLYNWNGVFARCWFEICLHNPRRQHSRSGRD